LASERDTVSKANVIRSEIRSRAELNGALPAFVSAPFTPTRYRAQTHWYKVDYVRVVDLDIGASKSDTRTSADLASRRMI